MFDWVWCCFVRSGCFDDCVCCWFVLLLVAFMFACLFGVWVLVLLLVFGVLLLGTCCCYLVLVCGVDLLFWGWFDLIVADLFCIGFCVVFWLFGGILLG